MEEVTRRPRIQTTHSRLCSPLILSEVELLGTEPLQLRLVLQRLVTLGHPTPQLPQPIHPEVTRSRPCLAVAWEPVWAPE